METVNLPTLEQSFINSLCSMTYSLQVGRIILNKTSKNRSINYAELCNNTLIRSCCSIQPPSIVFSFVRCLTARLNMTDLRIFRRSSGHQGTGCHSEDRHQEINLNKIASMYILRWPCTNSDKIWKTRTPFQQFQLIWAKQKGWQQDRISPMLHMHPILNVPPFFWPL